ncbi:MAG: NADPH:quinone oxidoreductase family protein [Chloroflexota bacterium]|nr:NADPH:quinone oxidoreductase family protein [Dehalococcoidia bacterium]MDW8252664.1 NADPH:quinone oxidoreductase family protein [Chloroflexota bacterium]
MRAVVLREYGGPAALRVEEVPIPEPGPGQVRIRVHASAMNNSDLQTTEGRYGRPPLPRIMGQEAAGIVDALGEGVTALQPGMRVVGHVWESWAEYAVAPAQELVPLPEAVSFEAAATLPIASYTASMALVSAARLQPGEWVLISPGTGGVGVIAVQLAQLLGGRVIATTSAAAKRPLLSELGAQLVLNWATDDVVAEVLRATAGEGVPVALDGGGTVTFAHCLASLTNAGRLVVYGYTTGMEATVPIGRLLTRNITIFGIAIWTNPAYWDNVAFFRERVLPAVAAGQIRTIVESVVPLEHAGDGLRLLAERRVSGKVVITP